jgi:hypothetical protein
VLWVAGYFGGHPQAAFPSAYLLDQTDGTTRATIDLTPTVQQRKPCHFHPSLVLDADTAWVATGCELIRLDARSGAILSRFPFASRLVATTPGSAWTTQEVSTGDGEWQPTC